MGTRKHHDIGFIAIAILKLVKGGLLFLIGVGALSLIHRDATDAIKHWAHVFQLDMHSRWIQRWMMEMGLVRQHRLAIITTSFFYSALLLTEGVGLLMEQVWAEYMTAIITTSFIPIELYELVRRVTFTRICVLAANVIVVAYLVMRLCQRRRPGADKAQRLELPQKDGVKEVRD
jgi:uncharacterized membrane protein (DUF2068 family)